MKTIHYAAGIEAACGMSNTELATIGSKVTCKACCRSRIFREDWPQFAIVPAEGGRPKAQGVQRTIKFWVSEDLNQWLNAQETVAGTIVQALENTRKAKNDF